MYVYFDLVTVFLIKMKSYVFIKGFVKLKMNVRKELCFGLLKMWKISSHNASVFEIVAMTLNM